MKLKLLTSLAAMACSLALVASCGSAASDQSESSDTDTTQQTSSSTQDATADEPSEASTEPSNSTPSGQITFGMPDTVSGFNPYQPSQATTATIAIANALLPSTFLVQADGTIELNSDLLDSAEVVSTDPQVIEYKVNPDAVWSDGTPIGIDDFTYLWQHLNGSIPDLQTTSGDGYSLIKSIEDDSAAGTITVTFSSPFGSWKSLFSPLLPAKYMASLGADPDAWNTGLTDKAAISGGPWDITEYVPNQYLTLKPNDQYYGNTPNLAQLDIRFFADPDAELSALQSGESDIDMNIKAELSKIVRLESIPSITMELAPSTNQQFLLLQQKSALISDKAVREALAIMVRPETLVTAVLGDKAGDIITNNHILSPGNAMYTDNRPSGYGTGDVDAAKSTLEAGGWTLGSDGVYEKDGTKLVLSDLIGSVDNVHGTVAEILQNALAPAGIGLEVTSVPAKDGFAALAAGNYDITFGSFPASSFPLSWYSYLYTCDGGYNFSSYCNTHTDELFDDANAIVDDQAQAEDVARQIDEQLWADIANIPLWVVPQLVAYDASKISGVQPALPREFQLRDAANWVISE